MLYRYLQTITLEELYGYINEIEGGYIKANYHPEDDNLVILNYTELTTFEKRWNKYTMSARGLILDLTEVTDNGRIYILAKPFDKFPNFGSNEIEGYEDDIDFNKIESIMEKMDGSLGVSYFFKGEIRFATRGSFTSEQAIKATEIWREKYSTKFNMQTYLDFPFTMLVEIIYPENRVVVDYDGLEDLVLLGCRYIEKNYDHDEVTPRFIEMFSEDMGMPSAKQYNHSIETLLEMKKTISANEEGWIIKFENGKRLKIKGEEYLQVHRIKHGMSTKAKYKAWAEGNLKEYIMMLPEEFRPELEAFEDKLERLKDSIYLMLNSIYIYAVEAHPERKDFAIHTQKFISKEYRKFMFDAYKHGRISEDLISEHIFDNYREYQEVIEVWNN